MGAARGRVVDVDRGAAFGVGVGVGAVGHDGRAEGHDGVAGARGVAAGAETYLGGGVRRGFVRKVQRGEGGE